MKDKIYCIGEVDKYLDKEYGYNSLTTVQKLEIEEMFINRLNTILDKESELFIIGDANYIKYLPNKLPCDVNLILDIEDSESFYFKKWSYMQQGFSRVNNKKTYIHDVIVSCEPVLVNKLGRNNIISNSSDYKETDTLFCCSLLYTEGDIMLFQDIIQKGQKIKHIV